jgi:hypothetical protein
LEFTEVKAMSLKIIIPWVLGAGDLSVNEPKGTHA